MILALGSTPSDVSLTRIFQDTTSEGLPGLGVTVMSRGQYTDGGHMSSEVKE